MDSISTHDIIFAVTALHNFINRYHNPFDEAEDNPETDEREEQSTEQNGPQNLVLGKREANERRDKIAEALCLGTLDVWRTMLKGRVSSQC